MFFCDPCAEERNWPKSICWSYGPCEICKTMTACNDVKSSRLPLPIDDGPNPLKEFLIKEVKRRTEAKDDGVVH